MTGPLFILIPAWALAAVWASRKRSRSARWLPERMRNRKVYAFQMILVQLVPSNRGTLPFES